MVKIATSESRRGLLEGFLELVSNFIEESKSLNITTGSYSKIFKTISAQTKKY
jgi:hypothetical protein